MQISLNGHAYIFCADVLARADTREGYFALAQTIYGLRFDQWYNSGYWGGTFMPYVLYDGDLAVSSVAVCVNDVTWQHSKKRYLQISTVMTLPEYRGKGLNRWLMEYVLSEWTDKCDAVYLLANDSVVDFYPKFGFEEFTEYEFTLPVKKAEGVYRRLNISDKDDLELLKRQYGQSNPFAALTVNNISQFMFHCSHFLSDSVYYLEQFDAVVIANHDGSTLICYDVFTNSACQLSDILGVLANEHTEYAYLGFTPKAPELCTVTVSQEEDNHLFVLSGKENIFKDNKVMFPLLSRA